jgi:hypothetical protein
MASVSSTSTANLASPTMSAQDIQHLSIISQELSWDVRASIVEMTTFGMCLRSFYPGTISGILTMMPTILAGFYLILFLMALYTILRRRQKTRRRWLLLAALLFTFAMTTITCSTHLARLIAKMQTILIDNTNLPFPDRVAAYNKLPWIGPTLWIEFIVMCGGDSGMMFMINDVLAIWRAVSVWTSGSATLMSTILYFLWGANFREYSWPISLTTQHVD